MKFVKYEVINQIKQNLEYYKGFFLDEKYDEKLINEFSIDYYDFSEIPSQYIFYDMSIAPMSKRKETDFINAIKIYEAYSFLSESQASDERFWCGIALEKNNMQYLFYRWGETTNTIKYRLTYHQPGKRGMVYHGLARLWWFVHLTILDGENPYEFTSFCFQYPHIMEKMIYRNFSNSRHIRLAIIEAVKKFIDSGGTYSTSKIDELYKYVSLISGNKLLDIIPKNVLTEDFSTFLKNLP